MVTSYVTEILQLFTKITKKMIGATENIAKFTAVIYVWWLLYTHVCNQTFQTKAILNNQTSQTNAILNNQLHVSHKF